MRYSAKISSSTSFAVSPLNHASTPGGKPECRLNLAHPPRDDEADRGADKAVYAQLQMSIRGQIG